MCRWEEVADEPNSDRWIILLAYVMGLSIGVHILNLLAIPALVMIYYFKKYKTTPKGVLIALGISIAILAGMLYGLMPGFFWLSSFVELFFVNTLSMPFNSGLLFYIVVAAAALVWALYETRTQKNDTRAKIAFLAAVALSGVPFLGSKIWVGVVILAAAILLFFYFKKSLSYRAMSVTVTVIAMLLIGYSTFAVIVIRSNATPPMDQNGPDNVFSLMSYLSRDQYGDQPSLIYGPQYTAEYKWKPAEGGSCTPVENVGAAHWAKKPKANPGDKDQYVITGYKRDVVYDDAFCMLFPRMYSQQPAHIQAYKEWSGDPANTVDYEPCGQQQTGNAPSFAQNIGFFFSYQVNFMYWRYFMWNFSGRQNDMQSMGEVDHGNWITGINFIDQWMVGDQSKLPDELAQNKGRNTYFLLPFLLGLLGLFYLFYTGRKGREAFWIIFMLFFLMGIAIVIYLNQTPAQPRERDYAYLGSFYAFSIWIGLGVLAIYRFLEKNFSQPVSAIVATAIGLTIPAILCAQNWDDHDRSGRYTCRDFGENYLVGLPQNSIIFTCGDNDTFPLWYCNEVENFRPDVRVCNLSYLQTDWYIDQMKRQSYTSDPLPISWTPAQYMPGSHEVARVYDPKDSTKLDVNTAMQFVLSNDARTKDQFGQDIFPTANVLLPVDKASVLKSNTVSAAMADKIVPAMNLKAGSQITKSDMILLDMLRTNNWKRPMYIAATVGSSMYNVKLSDYFQREGIVNRIVPVKASEGNGINTAVMYDNLMHKYKWGGIQNPKVYLDENIVRMVSMFRMQFAGLAEALVLENKRDSALKVLDYAMKVIPTTTLPHDYFTMNFGRFYYELGQTAKGDAIMKAVAQQSMKSLMWYASLSPRQIRSAGERVENNMVTMSNLLYFANKYNRKAIVDQYSGQFQAFTKIFHMQ
jgi:MFS family permease